MDKVRSTAKILIMTIVGSILMGLISAAFLTALHFVSETRIQFPLFILLLPFVGILTSWTYKHYGKGSELGNNLIIKSVHQEEKVPFRMSVFATTFTLLSHLTGGSVGIEGTAVQIGGTIFNRISSVFKLTHKEKRILVMAGISAAFGSAFGTPLAGAFFGLEMSFIGKISYEAMLPCFLSSYVANLVTSLFGITHHNHPIFGQIYFDIRTILIVVMSSFIFGLAGRYFSFFIKKIKDTYTRFIPNYLARIFFGGFIVAVLILVFGMEDFAGLSSWMRDAAFAGEAHILDPIKKFILTVLTLGAGYQGGEVTPLFNIGASLGAVIGQTLDIEPSLLAALGMIAVFGSATNTPITTIMLGIELFGSKGIPYFIIVALISYYVTGHHSIYTAQVIEVEKMNMEKTDKKHSIKDYHQNRKKDDDPELEKEDNNR